MLSNGQTASLTLASTSQVLVPCLTSKWMKVLYLVYDFICVIDTAGGALFHHSLTSRQFSLTRKSVEPHASMQASTSSTLTLGISVAVKSALLQPDEHIYSYAIWQVFLVILQSWNSTTFYSSHDAFSVSGHCPRGIDFSLIAIFTCGGCAKEAQHLKWKTTPGRTHRCDYYNLTGRSHYQVQGTRQGRCL